MGTKLLGKPPVLEGKEDEYQDWSFVMRPYLGCVNTKYRPALKLIDTLMEQDRNQMLNLGPDHEQLSTTLYRVLSMTTKGKALRIVQSIDEGAGYMAWWKLRMEMEPRVQTRMLGILTSLLSVRFTEESRILDDLAEWEKKTRVYEEQSKEMMTDNMQKAVIMQALPNEVKNPMQLKQ